MGQLTGDGKEWNNLWHESEPTVLIQVRSLLGVEAEGFKVRLLRDPRLIPGSAEHVR